MKRWLRTLPCYPPEISTLTVAKLASTVIIPDITTVQKDASRLRKNLKVVVRIGQLQAEKEAVWRMQSIGRDEYIAQELLHISQNAKSCSARASALEFPGKHLGLFAPQPKAEVPQSEHNPEAV